MQKKMLGVVSHHYFPDGVHCFSAFDHHICTKKCVYKPICQFFMSKIVFNVISAKTRNYQTLLIHTINWGEKSDQLLSCRLSQPVCTEWLWNNSYTAPWRSTKTFYPAAPWVPNVVSSVTSPVFPAFFICLFLMFLSMCLFSFYLWIRQQFLRLFFFLLLCNEKPNFL